MTQTPFATTHPDSAVRYSTGIAGTFTPRGLRGLEVGAARFFHMPWPENGFGWAYYYKPFETFAKLDFDLFGNEVPSAIATNQLASVFARWVIPSDGMEFYFEFAREDNSHNLRDAIVQPDNNSGYMVGFRKAWMLEEERMLGLRTEFLRTGITHLHRTRRQEPFYIHGTTRQGHTHRGQLLGAAAGYGGEGAEVAVDLFDPDGRWTIRWNRHLVAEQRAALEEGFVERMDTHVLHALGLEANRFRRELEFSAGVTAVFEMNRHFDADAFNLNLRLGATVRPSAERLAGWVEPWTGVRQRVQSQRRSEPEPSSLSQAGN